MLDQSNFPYGLVSRGNMHNSTSIRFLESCYLAGHTKLAKKIQDALMLELKQEKAYYKSLEGSIKGENLSNDLKETEEDIKKLENMENAYKISNASSSRPLSQDTTK